MSEASDVDQLLRELQDTREQQLAVSDVLRTVARSEGLEAVFEAVVDAATRLCRADFGALYLVDGDVLRRATHPRGVDAIYQFEREHPHVRDRGSAIGRVALTRDIVHIPDVRSDPEYTWGALDTTEYRALLGVPILVEDELIGAANVVRKAPEPFTQQQIGLLRTFADQAAIAIANARLLDAVERQRTELARFVSPQVAELISSPDGERLLAGHRAYISCLFCDLRNFTAFAETAAPEDLLDVLREYHAALGVLIPEHNGTLEHFAGDGVMIFFNDPVRVDQHELKAVQFALAARDAFSDLARVWKKRGTELGLGIGIEAGYATLGRIGYEGRFDYGAVSPVTSLAARLSTRADAMQILVGPRVFGAVEEEVDASAVGDLELKGFARAIPAYEILGLRSPI